jgi:heme-degrading monooxygenase HmoA
MPVVVVVEAPSQQNYEDVVRKVTDGKKSRMESPSDWPAEGLLSHAAGQAEDGRFRVVDVWESEEAFNRFGETLVPILQDLGVNVSREMYPAHTFVTA